MSAPYFDGAFRFPQLTCSGSGSDPVLTFTGTSVEGVVVQLGASKALIDREEIAALAVLFPVRPPDPLCWSPSPSLSPSSGPR